MKMRKKLSVALVLAALLCLAGCGGQDNNTATNTGTPSEESVAETIAPSQEEPQATAEESEESTEAERAAEESTEAQESAQMPESAAANDTVGEAHSVLVAYFSATGTTRRLAEDAAEIMGAELYEIVPAEAYTDEDLNYRDKNARAITEMDDRSSRPEISSGTLELSQYDIIFVGYPIWCAEAPRIMDTFMESYDFSGKTIVPFCTSGSSGIGSSAKNLKDHTDESVTWLDGKRFPGTASKEDMADWIRELSLGIEVDL